MIYEPIHKYNQKKLIVTCICVSFLVCVFCTCLNVFGFLERNLELESAFVMGTMSLLAVYIIGEITIYKSERIILLLGFVLRSIFAFADRLNIESLMLTEVLDDDSFWREAVWVYENTIKDTGYRYQNVLKSFMYVFGENRLILQFINIFAWILTVMVIKKVINILRISSKGSFWGFVLLSFFPYYAFLSAMLLRESIITLLNTLSFYFFIKWYKYQKKRNLFFGIIPLLLSMMLHSGALGLLLGYIVFYVLYDKKRARLKLGVKALLCGFVALALLFFVYLSPLKNYFMSYIMGMDTIFQVQDKPFEPGGSDYLRDLPYTENYLLLIFYTILRSIFFYVSPVPWEWRGMNDAAAFVMDSCVHLSIVGSAVVLWLKRKKERAILAVFLLCILAFGAVFAWGVSNAGTAMRHRSKIVGIEAVLLCVMLDQKRICDRGKLYE